MSLLPRGEHALHPLLLALLLLILVVKPLVELGLLPPFAMMLGLQAVIIAGLFCLDEAANLTRNLAFLAVLASLGLQALVLGWSGAVPALLAVAGAALAMSVLVAAILRQSFAAGPISFRRIEGAIAAYLLIGLVFACLYAMLHGLVPVAFLHQGEPAQEAEHVVSYIFFSFVTLTTTGYGDIVPVHPVARSLAILEALTGQLYLAILLARLVSLQVNHRE
ncbi:potassium channel family protein [Sediminicoccus sp. KRV36]|uniref:potassium channel family protein n=1 Tax=Sediminicoccus sp. KRV36 TaxID=3133721 RepID=UPI00200F1CA3|nr:potassium channel family protein [Sediminicoccus rosea]UPY36008.1 potassium channel family protein [Sediminicoccus rosea]